ncbi:NADPH oxidase organizer 1a [Oryzias melastigma]|uniref:NADPH oxidase organizer 1a n=1 Tax=Oryzias melastigma TaxID=30732 RepID=A0A3B3C0R1_ORYME|nr:NADPH oxidase organizer 1a [Oryzias melastigma]
MEPERFPVSVRLIGVLHKEKSKMFITSVLWSDQNDIVIYRSLDNFRKMHKQVKKECTTARKMKKSERTLPRFHFKGNARVGKKTTKSMAFLKSLEKYCNELLNCEARISQSSSLIKFFQPKDQDLDKEFTKNSIMVMQTDAETCSEDCPDGNVTQPFVTETFRCVAPYETKDTRNKPFKVAVDDKLDVLIKDRTGWWLVENEEKRMAWFPAPYLEKLDDDDEDEDFSERGKLYTANKSYSSTCDDEISIIAGAVVEVLQKSDNGWWLVSNKGKVGYIPAMYLQPYNHPKVHMAPLQHDRQRSASVFTPALDLQQQSHHSRSHGNLLQLPLTRTPAPNRIEEGNMQRSHSMSVLQESQPSEDQAVRPANHSPTTTPTIHSPPIIMVETEGQKRFSISANSEETLDWDSFSDGSSSSSVSLTPGADDRAPYLSRTPPPLMNTYLSPTSNTEVRLTPSVSDPSLYKVPTSPKVPPRPQAREILSRCTTVTRKNADRGNVSPVPSEIVSR